MDKFFADLMTRFLEKRTDLFLINTTISPSGDICVIIDGDNGVRISDCVEVSRYLEGELLEKEYDFSLEVMSAGLSEPLTTKRQYDKNIEQKLSVSVLGGELYEGTLIETNNLEIVLEYKTREPKPIGKGKVTVKKQQKILYNQIARAMVKATFK